MWNCFHPLLPAQALQQNGAKTEKGTPDLLLKKKSVLPGGKEGGGGGRTGEEEEEER